MTEYRRKMQRTKYRKHKHSTLRFCCIWYSYLHNMVQIQLETWKPHLRSYWSLAQRTW